MVGFITGGLFGFGRSSASVLNYMGLLGNPSLGRGSEGVYVNASNGNLILQRQDEYVAARGHDLEVTRTYNSQTSLADDNNDRWRQSTDRRITLLTGQLNQANSVIQRVAGDGSRVKYNWDVASSSYLSTDGGGAYATTVAGGSEWVWASGDGQRIERYNNTGGGLIKSVEDLNCALDLALAASGCDHATVRHKPRLLSDNGPSYIAGELAEYIEARKMSHVRGAPMHPQTQGKIERWHQTLKNPILLENYFLPGDLEVQIEAFVEHYNNQRYHESLNNVTPADAYFGRAPAIIKQRERIKRQTIEYRRLQHRKLAA